MPGDETRISHHKN